MKNSSSRYSVGPSATSAPPTLTWWLAASSLSWPTLDDLAFRDRRAAQRRADAREQLALRERLHDVVVGAAVEPGDAIVLLARAVSMMTGISLRLRVALQLPRELEPADVRQHPVHEHEIGVAVGDRGARLARVAARAALRTRPGRG